MEPCLHGNSCPLSSSNGRVLLTKSISTSSWDLSPGNGKNLDWWRPDTCMCHYICPKRGSEQKPRSFICIKWIITSYSYRANYVFLTLSENQWILLFHCKQYKNINHTYSRFVLFITDSDITVGRVSNSGSGCSLCCSFQVLLGLRI